MGTILVVNLEDVMSTCLLHAFIEYVMTLSRLEVRITSRSTILTVICLTDRVYRTDTPIKCPGLEVFCPIGVTGCSEVDLAEDSGWLWHSQLQSNARNVIFNRGCQEPGFCIMLLFF